MKFLYQSQMIKPKKCKRQPRSPVNVIKSFNKFECLPIEECNIVEVEKKVNSCYKKDTREHQVKISAKQ